MTIKFSDRNPPRFASGDEVVCDEPGLTIVNPGGSRYQTRCARELGHEGDHCGRTSRDLRKEYQERKLQIQREVERLKAEPAKP